MTTTDDEARPAGAARPPRSLSPSRAADFKSCPLKYRYRVIDRLPEPPSVAAARGRLVHAVLEELFRLPAPERTPAAAAAAVGGHWSTLTRTDTPLADLVGDEELPDFLAGATELLHNYFTLEDPRRLEPEACEVLIETTVAADVPARGYVDRIDVSPTGLIRIVDYKTGKRPAPAYESEALFQLKFYALLLFRLRGVVPTRLLLLYLGSGDRLEYDPDEAELLAFEQTVAALWRTIAQAVRTGDFPPRRSALCRWCAFRPVCPEFGGTPPPYPLADG